MKRALLYALTSAMSFIVPASLCAQEGNNDKRAKWNGFVLVNGGTSFTAGDLNIVTFDEFEKWNNSQGEAKGEVGVKFGAFDIKTTLGATTSYIRTRKEAGSYELDECLEDFRSMSLDLTQSETDKGKYTADLDFVFAPDASNKLTFKYRSTLTYDDPLNINQSAAIRERATEAYSTESSDFKKGTFIPSIEYVHLFNKTESELRAFMDWLIADDIRSTIWLKGTAEYDLDIEEEELPYYSESSTIYRITPEYFDSDFSAKVRYKDINFLQISGLNLDFNLDLILARDYDQYSAATYIGEEWRDSTRYRENFDYLAMTVDPWIHATYDLPRWRFEARFDPQMYADRLKDDKHTQRLTLASIVPLFETKADWKMAPYHKLGLSAKKTISRPDYLKICWFQRPGSYIDELQQGNPKIRPASTFFTALTYAFDYKRFSTSLELGYEYVNDKIERTYNMQEIDGQMFRVFTWINAGYSNKGNLKLVMKWNGSKLKVNGNANVNYYVGVSNNGTVSKSSDFKYDVDASYLWDFGLQILGRCRYQSKIIRSYSTTTEYYGLDLRVSQKFGKFDVYLEGKDLLDRPIITQTFSEDETQGRVEIWNYNRRIFLLGLKYSF